MGCGLGPQPRHAGDSQAGSRIGDLEACIADRRCPAPIDKGHFAQETGIAQAALERDPRIKVEVTRDIEDLVDSVLMLAAHDTRGQIPAKAVLLGEPNTEALFMLKHWGLTKPEIIADVTADDRRIPVLVNAVVRRNVDGDECWFVHYGSGTVETEFGPISYGRGDYVVIPKAITHRFVVDGGVTMLQGVPPMYAKLVDLIDAGGAPVDAPRLRACWPSAWVTPELDAKLVLSIESQNDSAP